MNLHTRTLYAFQDDVCWNSSFKTNWLRNMWKVSSVCVYSTCPFPIITRCHCMRQNKLFAHKRWPTGRTMHCFLHGPRVFSKGDGYSRDIQILGSRDFKYRSNYFCLFFFCIGIVVCYSHGSSADLCRTIPRYVIRPRPEFIINVLVRSRVLWEFADRIMARILLRFMSVRE